MISFVIPAYNEERLLGRTISSIHDSTRPTGLAYEVLVVNDASTDRTPAIARSLGAEVIDVQLRHIAAGPSAAQRAAGSMSHCRCSPASARSCSSAGCTCSAWPRACSSSPRARASPRSAASMNATTPPRTATWP
ncbi:MAG: glycosyltransferase family 2 protein, partial [Planctomyces sp.]